MIPIPVFPISSSGTSPSARSRQNIASVSLLALRVIMSKKDKADKAADEFRSKVTRSRRESPALSHATVQVMGMGGKAMRDVAKALKRPPGTVFW